MCENGRATVTGCVRMRVTATGCVRMRVTATGCVRMGEWQRLDVWEWESDWMCANGQVTATGCVRMRQWQWPDVWEWASRWMSETVSMWKSGWFYRTKEVQSTVYKERLHNASRRGSDAHNKAGGITVALYKRNWPVRSEFDNNEGSVHFLSSCRTLTICLQKSRFQSLALRSTEQVQGFTVYNLITK